MKTEINLDLMGKKKRRKAINELKQYKKRVERKTLQFITELAEVGISVAQRNSIGGLGSYLLFHKEIDSKVVGGIAKGLVIAESSTTVYGQGKNHTDVEIDALLMVEYGSGYFATSPNAEATASGIIAGQGTFPDQKYAFDPNGWWYERADNGKHIHTYGYEPQAPMQKAYEEMRNEIMTIAKRVFSR